MTINSRFIPWFHQQIGKYGLRERVIGIHSMGFEPGQKSAAYGNDAKAEGKPMVAQGIDVLIPGGGIPMLLFSNFYNHMVNAVPKIMKKHRIM